MEFRRLFEPLQVKNIVLRNRVVMSAACTEYGTEDGYVTDRLIDYYAERAKGGRRWCSSRSPIRSTPGARCWCIS